MPQTPDIPAATPAPRHALPQLNELNRPFWTYGNKGALHILRCTSCSRYIHPPLPVCPRCLTKYPAPTAVSGRGQVVSFTVNHQPWYPGLAVPFVVAIIELDEQPDLRVTSNVVGCAPESVHIGMRVQVFFEQHEDVWLPLFTSSPD